MTSRLAALGATALAGAALASLATPAAAFDLGLGFRLGGECGWRQAPYELDWKTNMHRETNLAGAPTLAHGLSVEGPALPVAIHYGGNTERFSFDSPKVGDAGPGVMEIRQNLISDREYTTVELWFDRGVRNLAIEIHDFDEAGGFPQAYADRLVIRGQSAHGPAWPLSTRVEVAGRTDGQQAARRDLRSRSGRDEADVIHPIRDGNFSRMAFAPITAHFDDPVRRVAIHFGSAPNGDAPRALSSNPAPQRLVIGRVAWCVDHDNS